MQVHLYASCERALFSRPAPGVNVGVQALSVAGQRLYPVLPVLGQLEGHGTGTGAGCTWSALHVSRVLSVRCRGLMGLDFGVPVGWLNVKTV